YALENRRRLFGSGTNARQQCAELQRNTRHVLKQSVVHLPRDARSLFQDRLVVCLDRSAKLLLGALALDSLSDNSRDRANGLERFSRHRNLRKHRDHADYTIVHNEWIAGEGDNALLPHPLLIDERIAECGVGEIWNASLCDESDLALPDRNA